LLTSRGVVMGAVAQACRKGERGRELPCVGGEERHVEVAKTAVNVADAAVVRGGASEAERVDGAVVDGAAEGVGAEGVGAQVCVGVVAVQLPAQ
jgi:hypothetical protein